MPPSSGRGVLLGYITTEPKSQDIFNPDDMGQLRTWVYYIRAGEVEVLRDKGL